MVRLEVRSEGQTRENGDRNNNNNKEVASEGHPASQERLQANNKAI